MIQCTEWATMGPGELWWVQLQFLSMHCRLENITSGKASCCYGSKCKPSLQESNHKLSKQATCHAQITVLLIALFNNPVDITVTITVRTDLRWIIVTECPVSFEVYNQDVHFFKSQEDHNLLEHQYCSESLQSASKEQHIKGCNYDTRNKFTTVDIRGKIYNPILGSPSPCTHM